MTKSGMLGRKIILVPLRRSITVSAERNWWRQCLMYCNSEKKTAQQSVFPIDVIDELEEEYEIVRKHSWK